MRKALRFTHTITSQSHRSVIGSLGRSVALAPRLSLYAHFERTRIASKLKSLTQLAERFGGTSARGDASSHARRDTRAGWERRACCALRTALELCVDLVAAQVAHFVGAPIAEAADRAADVILLAALDALLRAAIRARTRRERRLRRCDRSLKVPCAKGGSRVKARTRGAMSNRSARLRLTTCKKGLGRRRERTWRNVGARGSRALGLLEQDFDNQLQWPSIMWCKEVMQLVHCLVRLVARLGHVENKAKRLLSQSQVEPQVAGDAVRHDERVRENAMRGGWHVAGA